MNLSVAIFLGLGMTLATVSDFKTGKIPNQLNLSMMLLGLTYHSIMSGWAGVGFSLAGLFTGIGIFLIPYLMGGMGAGDAKLMGATGAFLGFKGIIIVAAVSTMAGLIYAMVLLMIHSDYTRSILSRWGMTIKTLFRTGQVVLVPHNKNGNQPVLRYALPIALGTIFYAYVKISGSNMIQDFLGFQFSL